MENPFEIILERLDRIEKTIEQLSANGPLAHANDPMNIKDLAAYLKISVSTIYKFTSTGSIPHVLTPIKQDYSLKETKLMNGYLLTKLLPLTISKEKQ
jgi:hypothetical protein